MGKSLKNIVVVYDYAHINGGAARVAIESAIALSKQQNLNVYYVAEVGPVCEELKSSAVHVLCFNRKDINESPKPTAIIKGIWNFNAYKDIKKAAKNLSPKDTIVHVHGWSKALSVSVISYFEKRKFPVIITLHDYFCICPNGGLYNYKNQCICEQKPGSFSCLVSNCDKRNYAQKIWRSVRFLVQTSYIKNSKNVTYISISKKNEELVKGIVRSNKFYQVKNPTSLINSSSSISNSENYYLYVGRVSEEKGCEIFCKAIFNANKQSKIQIHGIVIGDGPIYKNLKNQYPNILFTGWKEKKDVEQYMKKARALVLPSKWYEGAPLTIVEGLMNGTPCIVSDCTTAAELFYDGNYGDVFEASNAEALTNILLKYQDEDYWKYKKRTILSTFNSNQYNITIHTQNLLKLYFDIQGN